MSGKHARLVGTGSSWCSNVTEKHCMRCGQRSGGGRSYHLSISNCCKINFKFESDQLFIIFERYRVELATVVAFIANDHARAADIR